MNGAQESERFALSIVSGGQTGVDRGALDAALLFGVPCGGWCPAGRQAEDGRIPEHYPLKELPGAGYLERTRQNVIDSDGTLIVAFGTPTGGTAETIRFCRELGKPHLIIDGRTTTAYQAAPRVQEFVEARKLATLNVAGPRASGESGAYQYAFRLLCAVIWMQGSR